MPLSFTLELFTWPDVISLTQKCQPLLTVHLFLYSVHLKTCCVRGVLKGTNDSVELELRIVVGIEEVGP